MTVSGKKRDEGGVEGDAEQAAFAERVGGSIRAARHVRGWTQVELAEQASLSSNYVARLERGELGPSLWVAHRIARALGVTLDALLASPKCAPPIARTKFARSKGERYDA